MVASHNRDCGRTNYCYYLGGAELVARGILLLYVELRDIPNFLLIITVGFPVVNRYVWGMYGSQFVIWNRILLSIGKSECLVLNMPGLT